MNILSSTIPTYLSLSRGEKKEPGARYLQNGIGMHGCEDVVHAGAVKEKP